MCAQAILLPRMLDASQQRVFFEKSKAVYADEDYSVKPPSYQTIVKLMDSLRANGPLVAEGEMDPASYKEPAFKLQDRVGGKDIYGWKPGTPRVLSARIINVMLLGASQVDETHAYVYFTVAEDITRNEVSAVRAYKPSDTDTKIYILSYEKFQITLIDLHSHCPYGGWLFSIVPLASILDEGEGERSCKAVGQKIFDYYKANFGGDSFLAKEAVQRICDAAKFISDDGRLRKAYIERAWDRIGDDNWRWQH